MHFIKKMTIVTVGTILIASCGPSFSTESQIGAAILMQSDAIQQDNITETSLHITGAIDIQKMRRDEVSKFDAALWQRVQNMHLPNREDEQATFKILRDVFDQSSGYYGNLERTTTRLIAAIDANHHSGFADTTVFAARHGRVSTRVLGVVLDTVIAVSVGGGIGAATALIRRKGKRVAKRLIQKRVVRKLKAMGLGRAAGYANLAADFALNYSMPGSALARFIDSRDRKRNNGWIELW